MRDFDALLAEVKDLKYIQETNNQEMGKLFKLSTSNRDMLGNILKGSHSSGGVSLSTTPSTSTPPTSAPPTSTLQTHPSNSEEYGEYVESEGELSKTRY